MTRAFFRTAFSMIALVGLLSGLNGWADKLHMYDGTVMYGKIKDATGDLITVKQGLGRYSTVKRLSLAHRKDVVRTRKGTYTGEIIYMDGFRVEIETDTGLKRVLRLFVEEISLGDPGVQPATPPETRIVGAPDGSAFRPVHFQPAPERHDPLKPVVRRPSEVPAQDDPARRPSEALDGF